MTDQDDEPTTPAPPIAALPFAPGHILTTRGAADALAAAGIDAAPLLTMHTAGNYGALPLEDWRANNAKLTRGLRAGGRVLSVYPLPSGAVVWLITEYHTGGERLAAGNMTTYLTPDEY